MLKLRTTQQFKDAISEARRVFGHDDNSCTQISKRALRWFKSQPMSYMKSDTITIPKLNGIGIGSPTTIRLETELNNKDFQMVVIMYVNEQIEKYSSRIKRPLQLDNCDNYEIKGNE